MILGTDGNRTKVRVQAGAGLTVTRAGNFNAGYTVFGRVVEGMDVVDRIRVVPTGKKGPFPGDVPQTPVVIERAQLLED